MGTESFDEADVARLRRAWQLYRERKLDLDLAREQLDAMAGAALAGGLKQAELARVLGCSRQEVQEIMRRNERRRERAER